MLTCAPETTEKLLNDYEKAGIKARIIGTITKSSQGCMYLENGDLKELVPPSRDKFWDVFFEVAALHANKIQSEEEKLCAALKQTAAIFCDENIYKLLPEIGANIACVKKNGKQLSQVAGIPGRIISVKNKAVAASEPEMGASVHMGESILEVRKYFPEAACIMNLRKNKAVLQACNMAGLTSIDMSTLCVMAAGFYMWPHFTTNTFSAKDPDVPRHNAVWLPVYHLLLICPMLVGFTALLVYMNNPLPVADMAFLYLVKDSFPVWVLGIVGGAGALACMIPAADLLLSTSLLISRNIYIKGFRGGDENVSPEHMKQAARYFILILTAVALYLSIFHGNTFSDGF